MVQTLVGVAALITALTGLVLGIVGVRRERHRDDAATRAGEAQARAEAVEAEMEKRSDAARIGLEYMRSAMKLQEDTLTRVTTELGVVQGRLDACRDESRRQRDETMELNRENAVQRGDLDKLTADNAALREKIESLTIEIAALKGDT